MQRRVKALGCSAWFPKALHMLVGISPVDLTSMEGILLLVEVNVQRRIFSPIPQELVGEETFRFPTLSLRYRNANTCRLPFLERVVSYFVRTKYISTT